jgi:hypothetical protein
MDFRLVHFPEGNACIMCNSIAFHMWVAGDSSAVWLYCLGCCFTESDAFYVHYNKGGKRKLL